MLWQHLLQAIKQKKLLLVSSSSFIDGIKPGACTGGFADTSGVNLKRFLHFNVVSTTVLRVNPFCQSCFLTRS